MTSRESEGAPATAEAARKGESSNGKSPAPLSRASNAGPFVWTAADRSFNGQLAAWLMRRDSEGHLERVIEAGVELQGRAPTLLDAWVYFNAARLLESTIGASEGSTPIAIVAGARAIGARIAYAVAGFSIVNVQLGAAGASRALVVTPHRRAQLEVSLVNVPSRKIAIAPAGAE